MAKPKSVRSEVGRSCAGSSASGNGRYAVMATLVGSYGECCHRIVGSIMWSPEDAAKYMLKKHEQGLLNLEMLDVQSGKRVSVEQLIQAMEGK